MPSRNLLARMELLDDGHQTSSAELHILKHAIRIFGRRGYGGTSVRQIATEAGVTAPLIGYHFGSKEGLYRLCGEIVMQSMTASVLDAVAGVEDLCEGVRRFVQAHLAFARGYPDALRFALNMFYGPEEAQPEVDLLSSYSAAKDWVLELMRSAVEQDRFHPRGEVSLELLTRHLFHVTHMEVLSIYELQRYQDQLEGWEDLACVPDDPVEEIVQQFFSGAGDLCR